LLTYYSIRYIIRVNTRQLLEWNRKNLSYRNLVQLQVFKNITTKDYYSGHREPGWNSQNHNAQGDNRWQCKVAKNRFPPFRKTTIHSPPPFFNLSSTLPHIPRPCILLFWKFRISSFQQIMSNFINAEKNVQMSKFHVNNNQEDYELPTNTI
jgi:hypothetical protein